MPNTQQATTGRYLVLLRTDRPQDSAKRLSDLAQVSIASVGERESGKAAALQEHCALVFDHIGVALIRCTPDRLQPVTDAVAANDSAILAIEPERTVYAISAHAGVAAMPGDTGGDESGSPWGVQAVGAASSPYTGKGIRIAVLDTGLDLRHPDFASRAVTARSFVDGQTVQDAHGHGTHCAGIAAGPAGTDARPRYGVASGAELYIGKVLGDEGSGVDGDILEAMDWAGANGCHIVSMSLGSSVEPGQAYSTIFEAVAKRALAAGTLIVAAAGNDSSRPEKIAPVGHPANCPSIMAVAAVDRGLRVATFSSGGLHENGGKVDIAAPGVDILSAWPEPEQYQTISGTSMAAPFVAEIAALYAEADPVARAESLVALLAGEALHLEVPERDIGAGLVQSPQAADKA